MLAGKTLGCDAPIVPEPSKRRRISRRCYDLVQDWLRDDPVCAQWVARRDQSIETRAGEWIDYARPVVEIVEARCQNGEEPEKDAILKLARERFNPQGAPTQPPDSDETPNSHASLNSNPVPPSGVQKRPAAKPVPWAAAIVDEFPDDDAVGDVSEANLQKPEEAGDARTGGPSQPESQSGESAAKSAPAEVIPTAVTAPAVATPMPEKTPVSAPLDLVVVGSKATPRLNKKSASENGRKDDPRTGKEPLEVALPIQGAPLSSADQERKEILIQGVKDRLLGWIELNIYAEELRANPKYYATQSFHEFCKETFQWAYSTCYEHAANGRVLLLLKSGMPDSMPTSERQVRPLRDVKGDEKVIEIWSKAVVLGGTGGITESIVRKARSMVVGRPTSTFEFKAASLKLSRDTRRLWDKCSPEEKRTWISDQVALLEAFDAELESSTPKRANPPTSKATQLLKTERGAVEPKPKSKTHTPPKE